MNPGRPPLRANLVDQFDADPESKLRLKVVLETIAGQLTVADACQKLGIGQARFFELRTCILRGALQSLQPKPLGRPAQKPDPENQRIRELEQENLDLRVHLTAAQLREEIALVMPHLSNRYPAQSKKKRRTASPATEPSSVPTHTARSFQITRPIDPNSEPPTPGNSDT